MLRGNYNLGAKGSVSFTNVQGTPQPNIANLSDLANFAVTNWNQWEAITYSLYDSLPYPNTGLLTMQFFQVPIGGGTGFGGGPKTLSDTNLVLNGQLPQGQMFIATSVEIDFQPITPTATFAAQLPASFGAGATANIVNDAYVFRRAGNLTFTVLSKNYLSEAPLMRFPATADFVVDGAFSDATTAAAAQQSRLAWATTVGAPYVLTPNNILIPSTTNFSLNLAWPEGVQALPSGAPARVFGRLNGLLFRLSQ